MIPLHLRDLKHSKLHVLKFRSHNRNNSFFGSIQRPLGFVEMRDDADLQPIHVTPNV